MKKSTTSPIRSHLSARAAGLTIASITALALATGCGGSSDDKTSSAATGDTKTCTAAADAFLDEHAKLPTALPPGMTPLSEPIESAGTVVYIANGNIVGDGVTGKAVAQAAEAIGWTGKVVIFDGGVEDLNAKFNQAVSEKPDIIINAGTDAATLSGPLASAAEAGIATVTAGAPDDASATGWQAVLNGMESYDLVGKINAYKVLQDSGCQEVDSLVANLPYPVLERSAKSFADVITQFCDGCDVVDKTLLPADLGSPSGTNALVAAIQSQPSIKYVFGTIGNTVDSLPPALAAANITDVTIGGAVPSDQSIQGLRDGSMSWWVNQDLTLTGWRELDAGLRVLDTGKPSPDLGVSLAGLLTPDNVSESGQQPVSPADYQDEFKKLWGVS